MSKSIAVDGRFKEIAHPLIHNQRRSNHAFFLMGLLLMIFLISACAQKEEQDLFRAGTGNISAQKFVINTGEGSVINGRNGVIFAIPQGAFFDSLGNPITGAIEIQIKEANTLRDILAGGMITQTGTDLLATGGMYLIEAFQNGLPLVLDPAQGIYAYFPSEKKDPNMGLYVGEFNENKLDWKLTGEGENSIVSCDATEDSRKKCRKCQRLEKMAKRLKTGKKPGPNEYWTKRHYWENGTLYFASSGSRKPILSNKLLEECKDYLRSSEAGRDLLAKVDKIREEQLANVADYYTYRIQNLGWYNIDKLVKDDLMVFNGKVIDEKGNPVREARVHLLSTDKDMRVHVSTTAEDGSFEMKFAEGMQFNLYACKLGKAGKRTLSVSPANKDIGSIQIAVIEEGKMEKLVEELM